MFSFYTPQKNQKNTSFLLFFMGYKMEEQECNGLNYQILNMHTEQNSFTEQELHYLYVQQRFCVLY